MNLAWVQIPAGTFQMGSDNDWYAESPPRAVTIDRPFWLTRYPITQRQWAAVMNDNPARFAGSLDRPVDSVSWDMAMTFCATLSAQVAHPIRLPSEAEWEYALRAGSRTDFFFSPTGPIADSSHVSRTLVNRLRDYAWFAENCNGTVEVGQKQPNPWGLHDMIGNVWEWCSDVWHSDYHDAPRDGAPRLDQADTQPRRVLRGGAWDMDAFRCRSSYRSFDVRHVATDRFGLRVASDHDPGS